MASTTYRSVQWAWYPFPILVVIAAIVIFGLSSDDIDPAWLWAGVAFIVLMLWIVLTFSRLVVTVDAAAITAAFGPGWPKKVIPMSDVVSAETVRNTWWYGWGIRWLPGGTWMYNVQGLDAIEVERRGAAPFRIGTDDPMALLQAIRDVM